MPQTVYCRWKDETARERTGHRFSYAKGKKMTSLQLHPRGCLMDSLRVCSSLEDPILTLQKANLVAIFSRFPSVRRRIHVNRLNIKENNYCYYHLPAQVVLSG